MVNQLLLRPFSILQRPPFTAAPGHLTSEPCRLIPLKSEVQQHQLRVTVTRILGATVFNREGPSPGLPTPFMRVKLRSCCKGEVGSLTRVIYLACMVPGPGVWGEAALPSCPSYPVTLRPFTWARRMRWELSGSGVARLLLS